MNTRFKLCLMAAGRGTRNNNFLNLHKALLPLANRPVVSYILDCVDLDIEVVIALGHLSHQLKSYLEYVYPQRNFTFVDVDKYEGAGSGPGYSLLQCKRHLQCPFIFTSIDTLFNAKLQAPKWNWVGVCNVNDPTGYCLVDAGHNDLITKFYYLDHCDSGHYSAFIGIAGIYDYNEFWEGLVRPNIIKNEYQVINGFAKLDMGTQRFVWHDTGTSERYERTKEFYPQPITSTKRDEILYLDNNKVVKFFSDPQKLENRMKRTEVLGSLVPETSEINENMYGYDYIIGDLLSNTYDERLLDKFIEFCGQWMQTVESVDMSKFMANCDIMYRCKTYDRIKPFISTEIDSIKRVNGVPVLGIKDILDKIDWESLNNQAIPFLFHGDFQPENIIMNWDHVCLLDWRDSFGSDIRIGDMYYDLGKLHHALIVNGANIVRNGYSIEIRGPDAFVEVNIKSNLLSLEKKLQQFCEQTQLDWKHVNLLGALQYVTIASLYNDDTDYRDFLFLFGKLRLTQCIGN